VPVYWDRTAVVYVKDIPENSGVIARWGYRHLKPAYFSFRYLADEVRKNGPEPVLAEIARLVLQSPANDEPYLARAFVLFARGPRYTDQAIDDVRAAIATNPGRAMSRSALGMLFASLGRDREAEEQYRAALRLDPHDATALAGLKAGARAR
jgi:tetratricopeptide (TPR) repeat protein